MPTGLDTSWIGDGPAGRARLVLGASIAIVLAVSGCAGGGGLRGRPASVGSLRTAVSNLEFENDKLRREVADLKVENTRVADRLTQEEQANGDLAARLDDYRERFGGDDFPDGPGVKRAQSGKGTTTPAGSGRKAPFAKIPGRAEPGPTLETWPDDFEEIRPAGSSARSPRRESEPEARRRANDPRWLPIARGPDGSVPVR